MPQSENHFALPRRTWLGLGWLMVVMVLALCLTPLKTLPLDNVQSIDKVYHLIAFMALMWWFVVALPAARWPGVVLLLALLAIGIEITQRYVPYRAASVADVLADMTGVLLGAGLAWLTPAGFPPLRGPK